MKITGGKVFDLDQGFVERDLCFDGPLLTLDSQDGRVFSSFDLEEVRQRLAELEEDGHEDG